MADELGIARYRNWYRKLLRCYSRAYRERFAESMDQTFHDLCRERSKTGKGLLGFVIWVYVETFAGIVRENARVTMMQNKNVVRIAVVTALILLVPFLTGAPWTVSDFVAAGVLLFGTGLTFELVARNARNNAYRAAVGVTCATALLLVWLNLAVGLIGSEDNPANNLYAGVLAVVVIGASIARLEPRGMARTLVATAIAQALVPVIAIIIWRPPLTFGVVQVLGVNTMFVALWAVAAALFRHAAGGWSRIAGDAEGRAANRSGM